MKKNIFNWMTVMLMAFSVCAGFTACGGDDDDELDNRTNSTESTGGSSGTQNDVLKPGLYYCLERSVSNSLFTDCIAMGNIDAIDDYVNEYEDLNAIRVEKGDKLGYISVLASLSPLRTDDEILVGTHTYTYKNVSKKVYFYVIKDDRYVWPQHPVSWSEWSKNGSWKYENGNLIYVGEHSSNVLGDVDRVVYKYVK